jgi:hypothetical protein
MQNNYIIYILVKWSMYVILWYEKCFICQKVTFYNIFVLRFSELFPIDLHIEILISIYVSKIAIENKLMACLAVLSQNHYRK